MRVAIPNNPYGIETPANCSMDYELLSHRGDYVDTSPMPSTKTASVGTTIRKNKRILSA